MIGMSREANIEALSAVKQLTGHNVRLMPMDEVTELRVTETGAVEVWINRWRMEERSRDVKVTGKGIHIVTLRERLTDSGTKWLVTTMTAWDREQCMGEMLAAVQRADIEGAQRWKELHDLMPEGAFEPFFINHYGPGQTVGEWLMQRHFERMAGRVGVDRFPMDTFKRTNADFAAPKMTKHWN